MTRTTTITFNDGGVDLDVDFTYYKGEPQTRDFEGEDPYVEIEDVRICSTSISIFNMLSSQAIGNIEDQLFEQAGEDDDINPRVYRF